MPDCSKTNLVLAKAKPISDDGSTSVITYLRGKKTQPCITVFAAGERNETT